MDALGSDAILLMAACVVPWLVLEGVFVWRLYKRHGKGGAP